MAMVQLDMFLRCSGLWIIFGLSSGFENTRQSAGSIYQTCIQGLVLGTTRYDLGQPSKELAPR